MLWMAGQEREARQQRERLSESFVAVHDALQHALVPVVQMSVRKMPDRPRPWYLGSAQPAPRSGTPAQRDKMLAKLGLMFPGMVKTGRPDA